MKRMLLGIVTIGVLSGCGTARKKQFEPQYTVEALEIEVRGELPAGLIPETIYAANVEDILNTRQFQDPLFAVQQNMDEVTFTGEESPPMQNAWMKGFTNVRMMDVSVEQLMQLPQARVAERISVTLPAGAQFTEDRTESMELPVDYKMVDGKAVVSMTDTFKTGLSLDIQLFNVQDGLATYDLNLFIGHLKGFESYTLDNGETIKMPYLSTRSANTRITQPLDHWLSIGGLMSDEISDGTTNTITRIICMKITAPEATQP